MNIPESKGRTTSIKLAGVFIVWGIVLWTQGCGNDPELKSAPEQGQSNSFNGTGYQGNSGQQTYQQVPGSGPQTNAAGFGDGGVSAGSGTTGNNQALTFTRPTEYPSLAYSGRGEIFHRGGDDWISNRFDVAVTADSVTFNSTAWDSERSEVRDNLRRSLGASKWNRPSESELYYRERDDAFKRFDFLIYGTVVLDSKGRRSTLSSPIPILAKPLDLAQYRHLAVGQTYTYAASSRGATNYQLRVHIKKESEDGVNVKLTLIHEIVGANKGREYETWPLPYKTTFEVNTNTKRVLSLRTDTKWYESDKDRERTFYVNYGLCSYNFKGKIDNYNCPK